MTKIGGKRLNTWIRGQKIDIDSYAYLTAEICCLSEVNYKFIMIDCE